MTTTEQMHVAEPETIDATCAALFRESPSLPLPSLGLGFTASDLLHHPFVDSHILAVTKRLSDDPAVDNQTLIDILAYALFSDDPFFTAYNSLVLLGHFSANGVPNLLEPLDFVNAVAGLSHHNGEKGSESMHRLCDPDEIAGAIAVVIFIGTMDRDNLVQLSVLKHPESDGKYGLTITNKYLDRLLRAQPEHLPTVCTFLRMNRITGTKKSVQPLLDYLAAGGTGTLINGVL